MLKNGQYYLTSDYKTRNNSRSEHNGMDFIGESGSSDYVVAIADDKVITSKYSSSAGYYVEIQHFDNYISRYLYITEESITVKKGDVLGYMGDSGNAMVFTYILLFIIVNVSHKILYHFFLTL